MGFQLESSTHLNTITACTDQVIQINRQDYTESVLISPTRIERLAARTLSDLDDALWGKVIADSPEVLLIGTGAQHTFVSPAQLAPLYQAQIGVECMSSHAAARTYNVLMNEGRRVLAILLLTNDATHTI
ncbi:MAG: MTH938/NDUFAF3 family protein [Burkholderiales bacterium]|jgi:uncharacterized protein|nr:MTH938/NDUFAF3 family protein [Burkholderiales bacterium]MCE1177315.1 MTH938/NDUFAF3 family protein [Burkholderiales bacterium]